MTPQIRQWIYTAAAVASALIPLLVAYKVIDSTAARSGSTARAPLKSSPVV